MNPLDLFHLMWGKINPEDLRSNKLIVGVLVELGPYTGVIRWESEDSEYVAYLTSLAVDSRTIAFKVWLRGGQLEWQSQWLVEPPSQMELTKLRLYF